MGILTHTDELQGIQPFTLHSSSHHANEAQGSNPTPKHAPSHRY